MEHTIWTNMFALVATVYFAVRLGVHLWRARPRWEPMGTRQPIQWTKIIGYGLLTWWGVSLMFYQP